MKWITCNDVPKNKGSFLVRLLKEYYEYDSDRMFVMVTDVWENENGVLLWDDINRDDWHKWEWLDESVETNNEWFKILDNGWPEVGEPVEVITEFMQTGKSANERFIGYMDEYGALISYPSEDEYGWSFNDCVCLWRRLSPMIC